MIAIAILGISATILAVQFKGIKNEYGIYITVAACVIMFFYILTRLEDMINLVKKIVDLSSVNVAYVEVLIRVIGITYISEFASDVCRDCGYMAVSNQIQIFGKLTVLSLSIPVIEALIDGIGGML